MLETFVNVCEFVLERFVKVCEFYTSSSVRTLSIHIAFLQQRAKVFWPPTCGRVSVKLLRQQLGLSVDAEWLEVDCVILSECGKCAFIIFDVHTSLVFLQGIDQ